MVLCNVMYLLFFSLKILMPNLPQVFKFLGSHPLKWIHLNGLSYEFIARPQGFLVGRMLVQLYVYNGRKAQVNQVVQPLSRGHVESYNCPHEDCHKMGVPPFLDGPIVHIID